MKDLVCLLGLVGMTLIVVRGTIFLQIRSWWPALLECSQCVGTWVGAGAGASGIVSTGHGIVLNIMIVGTATSFLSLLADAVLLNLLGEPE